MNKETIKDSENINSDEWKFLLLMMLMEDIKQKNSQWKSFEDELIYKNRFSVKHAVIDEIHDCQANAVTIRKKRYCIIPSSRLSKKQLQSTCKILFARERIQSIRY